MKLSPEGARWMVWLRWLACAAIFIATWIGSHGVDVIPNPWPVYAVGLAVAFYNLLFQYSQRNWSAGIGNVEANIFAQIVLDTVALTLVLYFCDISRNPFLFFFVFHVIIASMYLHGWAPYITGGLATSLVGLVLLLEYLQVIPRFPMHFPHDPPQPVPLDGHYLLALFVAFVSTQWIAFYCTMKIHRYVDRAHEELRQREKMLGIGQLVAGIAHQIANPLDGVQNCLHRIGEGVRDDPRLTEYVQMMGEALERIEKTAKRVQAFARPRGIELQPTEVNAAIEATLAVLGPSHNHGITLETLPGDVPLVMGDPYTLQEVLFNLCTNALAAMPHGGTLTIRSRVFERATEENSGSVAVDVSDTGVGIARAQMEKIFEPFYTTRADSGGTGLGLGLCRMLISEMGGRIELRSALGQGTTFTVILNTERGSAPGGPE